MKEYGVVTRTCPGTAVITITPHEECHKCGTCAASRPRSMTVSGTSAAGLREGDRVTVDMEPSSLIRMYALIYGLPLAGLITGLLAAYYLTGSPIKSFACALLIMLAVYAGIAVLIRGGKAGIPEPVVTRVSP